MCQQSPDRTRANAGAKKLLAAIAVVLLLPHAHQLAPAIAQVRQAGMLPNLTMPKLPGGMPQLPNLDVPAGKGNVCPVHGRHAIGSGWGDCRDGCSRRHKGIDVMARAGTPLVAVAAGTVTRVSNTEQGLGGITLWLRDKQGTAYYYAHNQRNLAHAGQRVKRGQRIALVGNTGNARGGAPHLHFEIHPGGGRAVDPGPQVRRWC